MILYMLSGVFLMLIMAFLLTWPSWVFDPYSWQATTCLCVEMGAIIGLLAYIFSDKDGDK